MNTMLLFLGMGISWSLEILTFYMLNNNDFLLITAILNMFQVNRLFALFRLKLILNIKANLM